MSDKKYKRTLIKATPLKMSLEPGDTFIGEFIKFHKVERPPQKKGGDPQDFISYDFKTDKGVYVYLTGTGFEDVNFKAGNMYEILYNGMTETVAGNPFKSFTIFELT
jgi:hypothetical protein